MTAIIRLRALLLTTGRLYFRSQPLAGSQTDWAGQGEGDVEVEHVGDVIRFHERGSFLPRQASQGVSFQNVYRWTLHDERVSLHHERRGAAAAVWLFDLVPHGDDTLVSEHAHVCVDDLYAARLAMDSSGFELAWTITGPRKNERLYYRYSGKPQA